MAAISSELTIAAAEPIAPRHATGWGAAIDWTANGAAPAAILGMVAIGWKPLPALPPAAIEISSAADRDGSISPIEISPTERSLAIVGSVGSVPAAVAAETAAAAAARGLMAVPMAAFRPAPNPAALVTFLGELAPS
jgi:hypothetical protein